jgi:hypothetical protein
MPPLNFPFLLAAAILSRVRSLMISRSNWAKLSRMFKVKRPMEWVVLNCWVTELLKALGGGHAAGVGRVEAGGHR